MKCSSKVEKNDKAGNLHVELALRGDANSCHNFLAGGALTKPHHLTNISNFIFKGILTIKKDLRSTELEIVTFNQHFLWSTSNKHAQISNLDEILLAPCDV